MKKKMEEKVLLWNSEGRGQNLTPHVAERQLVDSEVVLFQTSLTLPPAVDVLLHLTQKSAEEGVKK